MLRRLVFLERMDGFLLTSDSVDRYQYLDNFQRRDYVEPEKRLMLAVLADALKCLAKNVRADGRRCQMLYCETEEWLFSDGEDWILPFGDVCEALGLNPGYIRRQVLCWKKGCSRIHEGGARNGPRRRDPFDRIQTMGRRGPSGRLRAGALAQG